MKKNVVFMLTRVTFWNIFEGLYNKFLNDDEYEPTVLICGETINHVGILYPQEIADQIAGKDEFEKADITHNFNELKRFADENNLKYILGLDRENKNWVELEDLNPDLVIYCDPYDKYYIRDSWKPVNSSSIYKTVYIPYAYLVVKTMAFYKIPIVSQAWKVFLETQEHRLLALEENGKEMSNLSVLGYPKFDKYFEETSFKGLKKYDPNKYEKTIIYAPHWTVSEKENRVYSQYGNFINSKDEILKVMKENKNIFWVFRPHPLLFDQIKANYGIEMAKQYFSEFVNLENVEWYKGYDYIALFKTTDSLILDSNSFIAEYMPTGKPIIFLQKNENLKLNEVGNDFISGCHIVKDFNEIGNKIEEVVLEGKDDLKHVRDNLNEKYILCYENPSNRIYEHIINEI